MALPPSACSGELACAVGTEHTGLVVGQDGRMAIALGRRDPNLGLRFIARLALNAHRFDFRIRIHQRPAKVWQTAIIIRRLYINAVRGGG